MEKILIVDDSKLMRKLIRGMVDEIPFLHSCELFEVEDGEKADELLSREKIDLILLDWNMPKINGLEVAKKINSNAYDTRPVIVMITSEAAKYNIIEALESGVNHYLVKPIVKKDLMEILKKI